jgi:dihydrofolate reductase
MIVSLIVAMDEHNGIGLEGRLPWRLPADLKRFKVLTMGHHLIMGRKTYQSIGRPLPGRTMIILTRQSSYDPPGCDPDRCLVAHNLEQALEMAAQRGESEAFVIGGADVFREALQNANRIYLTRVHTISQADVYFPEWDPQSWVETYSEQHPADEKNEFSYTFKILQRNEKIILPP